MVEHFFVIKTEDGNYEVLWRVDKDNYKRVADCFKGGVSGYKYSVYLHGDFWTVKPKHWDTNTIKDLVESIERAWARNDRPAIA